MLVTNFMGGVRRPLAQNAAPDSAMVRLTGIVKVYRGQRSPAVDELTLDIREGEIFSLLGPSGCGKTTTLRIVAGLETPDRGSIYFKDKPIVVTGRRIFVPPEKRQVGMVFQSYAIWPHMTVEQNVSYPLKARGCKRSVIEERVADVLGLVGMSHFADRPATLLSGGQQQRVALARALVYKPSLLLLDEPFSNLDSRLREQMREEVKQLQSKLGVTILFVTHDQVEALSLSDRLAVMHQGRIQQVGDPRELYEKPANQTVRDFLGRSVLLSGSITAVEPFLRVRIADGGEGAELTLPRPPGCGDADLGRTICVSIRPEDIMLTSAASMRPAGPSLVGVVETASFEGERTEHRIRIEGQGSVHIFGGRRDRFNRGDAVRLSLASTAVTPWLS